MQSHGYKQTRTQRRDFEAESCSRGSLTLLLRFVSHYGSHLVLELYSAVRVDARA